jgi:hypothetical protein
MRIQFYAAFERQNPAFLEASPMPLSSDFQMMPVVKTALFCYALLLFAAVRLKNVIFAFGTG